MLSETRENREASWYILGVISETSSILFPSERFWKKDRYDIKIIVASLSWVRASWQKKIYVICMKEVTSLETLSPATRVCFGEPFSRGIINLIPCPLCRNVKQWRILHGKSGCNIHKLIYLEWKSRSLDNQNRSKGWSKSSVHRNMHDNPNTLCICKVIKHIHIIQLFHVICKTQRHIFRKKLVDFVLTKYLFPFLLGDCTYNGVSVNSCFPRLGARNLDRDKSFLVTKSFEPRSYSSFIATSSGEIKPNLVE